MWTVENKNGTVKFTTYGKAIKFAKSEINIVSEIYSSIGIMEGKIVPSVDGYYLHVFTTSAEGWDLEILEKPVTKR